MRKTTAALLIFCTLLLPSVAFAAVARDAVTATETTSASSPVTWSMTNAGAGEFDIAVYRCLSGDHLGTPTVGGTSMTLAVKQADPTGLELYAFILPNTSGTTQNFSASISAGDNCGGTSASFTGAQTNTTVDTAQVSETASGSRTVTVNVTNANSWLIASHSQDDLGATGSVNCSVVAGNVSSSDPICFSEAALTAGNHNIGFTWAGSDRHAIIAFSISPAGAAAATAAPTPVVAFTGNW